MVHHPLTPQEDPMTGKLRHLWKHHPVALTLFGAASILVLVFAVRITLATFYWTDPTHRQQHPEPWMTPRYVAHSWHLPLDEVLGAVGLSERPQVRRRTLEQIAQDRGVPVDQLIRDLATFLAQTAPAQ